MNPSDTKNKSPSNAGEPISSNLEKESVAAPESAWFFAWFKSAMLFIGAVTSYLVTVIGLVAVRKKLLANDGDQAHPTTYVVAGVVLLPLLFGLLFNLLPTLRRRRERNLRPMGTGESGYFTTAPREDDPHGLFAKGYESFLEWTAAPKSLLLHLTGLSGSGKSSLIGAYLKPRLAAQESGSKTIVLTVRSYNDPLAALKEALLALWKKQPADYPELSSLDSLRRAARQLDDNERLLVAFDQFEEFFLIRAGTLREGKKQPGTGSEQTTAVAETELAPLRDFLHAFLADPPERVAILLSYREDHRRLLAPLHVPARQDAVNWMMIDPLDFAAAAAFLLSCPGLKVPEGRVERVLREAARQEGGQVVMRPIVANLLGLVLQRMSSHPTLWHRTGDLLRGYVRGCLGEEVKVERARLLRTLLTDFRTARPRLVADVARETGLDPAVLDAHLDQLGRAGLLRCVNASEGDPARRIWQIAHDFLAALIERVLDGLHRTLWRTVRPWLAPVMTAVVIAAAIIWPRLEKQRAVSILGNAGFFWKEAESTIAVGADERESTKQLDHLAGAIRRLSPRRLNLSGCSALMNVDALEGLISLRILDLSGCSALMNVDALEGLTKLGILDLSRCSALTNVNGLRNLTVLQRIDISACSALKDVEALKNLALLQSLDLSGCTALQKVDALKNLTVLQNLDLSGCPALQNMDALRDLTVLKSLNLAGCFALKDVEALKNLAPLQRLDLSGWTALQKLDALKNLTVLQNLDLSGCSALQNVDALRDLTVLKSLDLSGCTSLKNVDALKRLTALQSLNLSGCTALQSVDALKGLSNLRTLDISFSGALKEGFQALQSALPDVKIVTPAGAGNGLQPGTQ